MNLVQTARRQDDNYDRYPTRVYTVILPAFF